MASSEPVKRCFLCVNQECMTIYDTTFFSKVTKYLEIKVYPSETLNFCVSCIEAVESFHAFYERIRAIHQGNEDWNDRVSQLVKVELYEEDPLKCDAPNTNATPKDPGKGGGGKNSVRESSVGKAKGNGKAAKAPKKRCRRTVAKWPKETVPRVRLLELMKNYENVACPLCSDKVNCATLEHLNVHFQEQHPGQKSFILCCEKVIELEDKKRLRCHLKFHRYPESCRCDVCGKTLASPLVLRTHKQLHLPESERKMTCEICGKTFGRKHDLYQHKIYVHTERLAVCQICGKELKPASLPVHMKQVHEGIKKTYVCTVCGKTLRCNSSFRNHMKVAHTDKSTIPIKKKPCPDCGKMIRDIYMYKHKRYHHRGPSYECSMCDRVFKLPESLREHMVSHTDERPFPCTVCGAAFKTKATLKIHMGQHTGTNQVKCPYCGKMISNPNNYIAHRRRMHLKEHMDSLKHKETLLDHHEGLVEDETQKMPLMSLQPTCPPSFVAPSYLALDLASRYTNDV